MEATVTFHPAQNDVDFVEEIRLRTWARHNYAPQDERNRSWHPVILDEMRRKDREQGEFHRVK
ncbi:hypothetical protein [Planctomicrobium piriforme]|uniref:Uncharacterized protein n=1 Tax=Planctomicrobium piriforme TaxID=1576369 RepID=A0A1I3H033_9PLAN|nr:hypothetical protein [Planctomicrobium piriforme]SFI29049.1 hypothetical protein SAMN05421753_107198 [Planctomicrobium piriforme]